MFKCKLMVIASLLFIISPYRRFHRNVLLLDSRENWYLKGGVGKSPLTEQGAQRYISSTGDLRVAGSATGPVPTSLAECGLWVHLLAQFFFYLSLPEPSLCKAHISQQCGD